MSKDLLRLHKYYSKLAPLERFKLSAQALARGDDDEVQWLRATSLETTYVGPEAAFRRLWDGVSRVLSIAYPTWVRHQTLLETTAQALHFVEMVHEQARDHASEYYCQGYKAAGRDAGRSEDEFEHTQHICARECDTCDDRCDAPAEQGIYVFSGLQKHESFIYRPAMDELQTQFAVHLIGIKALYIALKRLCNAQNLTLQELVAINPVFRQIIKESREFLMMEIGESVAEHLEKCVKVYFATLDAAWNDDVDYRFSETIRTVYGSEAAKMFLEWQELIHLADCDGKFYDP